MLSGRRAKLTTLKAAAAILFAALPSALGQLSAPGPSYTANGIVNAATQTAEALAPNTIATIYGTNLSYETASATASSLVGGSLPKSLSGVSVIVSGQNANIFFVSPTQINFLVPYQLTAGMATVIVACDGIAGPTVSVQLNSTSPAMFVYNGYAIATHLSGALVSPALPAGPGEIIVIFVVGLGRVSPDTTSGKIVTSAASISAISQLQVLLAGTACPASSVLYAGLAPGFAGLYQINLVVPPLTGANPQIQIAVGPQISPVGVLLATQAVAAGIGLGGSQ